jgi:hypothetical protein
VDPRFQTLSDGFRAKLDETLSIEVPKNAGWAFDYHLDWLAVALSLYSEGKTCDHLPEIGRITNDLGKAPDDAATCDKLLMEGNQQDADLLIAYDKTLVVVEAKAGKSFARK